MSECNLRLVVAHLFARRWSWVQPMHGLANKLAPTGSGADLPITCRSELGREAVGLDTPIFDLANKLAPTGSGADLPITCRSELVREAVGLDTPIFDLANKLAPTDFAAGNAERL